MRAIYFRTSSDQADAWIERERTRTGMSRAAIVNIVIEEAARRGWKVTPGVSAGIETEETAP